MAVITYGTTPRDFGVVRLANALTGNVSTDVLDRGMLRRGGLLIITSTIGATPTVTVNIVGSAGDGTFAAGTFWNIPYAAVATPETPAVAALTITTAVTSFYVLRPDHPWRFMRLDFTANTNVTLTVDVAA